MEEANTLEVAFKLGGQRYAFSSDVRVSARNVYYRGYFTLNGERKTSRLFSDLLRKAQ